MTWEFIKSLYELKKENYKLGQQYYYDFWRNLRTRNQKFEFNTMFKVFEVMNGEID